MTTGLLKQWRTRRNPDYQIRNRRIAGLTPVSSFSKFRVSGNYESQNRRPDPGFRFQNA